MATNRKSEATGWVGWIMFASFMMLLLGLMHIIAGTAALFKEEIFVSAPNFVWILDYTQWGWAHILGGIIIILAAGSLMQGSYFGRTVAVIVAGASALVNMAFIPIYPIWSTIMTAVCVLVIWAVIVHGDELRE